MVCDRCKRVVKEEIERIGYSVTDIDLGYATVAPEPEADGLRGIEQVLEANGFELLTDKKESLVEYIKNLIIQEVQHLKGDKPESVNFSDYLATKTGYEYSYLSHLFSSEAGTTIEQFLIAQRVEKVKEWLSYDELSVGEIAWRLGYSSAAHLSNQFKKVTGLTPGAYKLSANKARKSVDKLSLKDAGTRD